MVKISDTTPYRTRPCNQVLAEQAAISRLVADAEPVSFIYEAFGGVGLSTAVFQARFPDAQIVAFDLDPECVRIYNAKFSSSLRQPVH
jgi:trans-aconitate methyltransferase